MPIGRPRGASRGHRESHGSNCIAGNQRHSFRRLNIVVTTPRSLSQKATFSRQSVLESAIERSGSAVRGHPGGLEPALLTLPHSLPGLVRQ
jgi:hypothetical protein